MRPKLALLWLFAMAMGSGRPVQAVTEEEQDILNIGEISRARYITGGIVGSVLGFGVGHAIEGFYPDKGLLFTLGEAGGLAIMIASLSHANDNSSSFESNVGMVVAGEIAFIGFKVWEIIDIWIAPNRQNRAYRALKSSSRADAEGQSGFYLMPISAHGIALGLASTF